MPQGRQTARRSHRYAAGFVGTLLLAAGVAGAIVSNGERTPAAPGSAADGGTEGVERELQSLLAPFRRRRVASDELPAQVASRIYRYEMEEGENPRLARRLRLGGNRDAFVWPAASGLCYTYRGKNGSGCFPIAVLRELGVVLSTGSSSASGSVRVFAVVRDGIRRVSFRFPSGRTTSVPVRGNALLTTLPAPPSEASWRTPDGRPHRQRNLVPPPSSGERPPPAEPGPGDG